MNKVFSFCVIFIFVSYVAVEQSLIPQKRGPRFKIRRFDLQIEEEIVSLQLGKI